ncbi:sporulation protein [Sphingopyxis sp. H038]|uniref:SPOR domain-containing protein n=1 Tax=unclassified Sphingopyxis TaxID=2614943 RepID=UPI000730FFD9|nr:MULTISPECIES: SPOR domain-containing protein [unclassified Sphingopyxis]KTE04585.1 sporulation protein [Sphingopyxis sp. H012]KTE13203.1 sporulation protein [Sphingopyxis sp. H053]KTE14391.1 sporulation protein [Sphingopyxis sp. H093]KTE31041.1 sporulation protein [Sphingopyxis sp. H080]KTE37083.1 sporulation protein [Sphingopyxis sp. H038]
MRQAKLTAKPARARRIVGALAALLFGTAALPSVHAQVTPPDPATRAAMEKRTAARALLSSSLARIASNNSDTSALLNAGRASIELEDYRAAVGFLVRAEQASPRDGAVKAALGSAMVHMENPTRALDYFGEAQLMGAPERLFLADRGLARDLLGQQDAAQRDYQLALSIAPNDELTRRYALSLGISGDADRAIALLTPQLRAQDRGAWRLRAMILAMNGRDKEATDIVNATMPPAMAQNIMPYLTQMDRLNPAQQAAAAHFGRFPNGQLGPKRKPVQVAAATPPPAAPPAAATGKRQATRDQRRPVMSATPAPSGRKPVSEPVTRLVAATPAAASTSPGPSASNAPVLRSPSEQAIRKPIEAPAPSPSPAPTQAVSPVPPPASIPAASAPDPIGVAVDPGKGPVGPGFSIADMGRSTGAVSTPVPPAATEAVAPASSPAVNVAAATPASVSAAPLASLADIVGSIEIPAEELAQSGNAVGADTLARLMADKRKAEAAEAAKREKDSAAAKLKAEADAKAKEEAAEKKANPARIWVQVATGANAKALATDFGKFAKKSPAVFKGKSGATTEWGKTRRLLVGPFKDRKAAQDWLADHKKAGGDGFLFNSEAGQSVDPVK